MSNDLMMCGYVVRTTAKDIRGRRSPSTLLRWHYDAGAYRGRPARLAAASKAGREKSSPVTTAPRLAQDRGVQADVAHQVQPVARRGCGDLRVCGR